MLPRRLREDQNAEGATIEVEVHRCDLHKDSPEVREKSRAEFLALVGRDPKIATPAPAVSQTPSWAANKDVGAIYMQEEPGGTFRLSLVFSQGGAKAKQVSNMTGLKGAEVADAVGVLGKRLGNRALELKRDL